METQTIFVYLKYDLETKSLPPNKWDEIEINGLLDHHNPECEAICFALKFSALEPSKWPNMVYTSLTNPRNGCLVTRHSLKVL
jgi:hypothetical protein